ncbi:MAG: hypothetical protein HC902_05800 [Calothrix sp. SM1_5_4]|nr:hypothetical protein [Calothrix sp. SM1_5_4]
MVAHRLKIQLPIVAGFFALGAFVSPYMALATLNYIMMIAAIRVVNTNRSMHKTLMSLAVASDISLVLILEWQRHAVNTVVGMELGAVQMVHVGTSLAAILLYIPAIGLGLSGGGRVHRAVGYTAFAFRTAGFLTMFSMYTRL